MPVTIAILQGKRIGVMELTDARPLKKAVYNRCAYKA
jgi:hypothetical protein